MRPIKFRAWDKHRGKNGMMLVNHTFQSISATGLANLEGLIWMQFTGLHDKNGVEIYEFCELDNQYRVIYDSCSYVLQDISNGDIVGLLDNSTKKANEREITREYAPLEED